MHAREHEWLEAEMRWNWEQAYKKWFALRFIMLLIALALSLYLAYLYFIKIPEYETAAAALQGFPTHLSQTTDIQNK